jgi:phosphate transport system substrate-binding protein
MRLESSARKNRKTVIAKSKHLLVLFLLLPLLVVSVSGVVLCQDKVVLRVSGGSLLAEPVEDYGKLFSVANPQCTVGVSSMSTAKGFESMIAGEADMAMMTRPLTEAEERVAQAKGLTLGKRMLGHIALAIITNSGNPVNELTLEQVGNVFSGKIKNWRDVGGPDEAIKVLTRPVPDAGSGVLFQKEMLKDQPYAEGHQVMTSWQSMVKVCSRSLAVGYMPTTSFYFANMNKEGIKIIALRKDAKSPVTQLQAGIARDLDYPASVPFYLYRNEKNQNPCLMKFVDYIAGKAQ